MSKEYVTKEEVIETILSYGIGWGSARVRGVINNIPAAEAVEVVRCRECIYHEYDAEINTYVCTGPMAYSTTPDDWYCASGIYKDGE